MGAKNILWIVTTQWRAQATGYAGDPNARTPQLDRLAATSINFEQAITPHPMGPFARAALLTGMLSPDNGLRDYFEGLPAGSRTIAHALRDLGYDTAFFGKWHLSARDRTDALVGEAHAKQQVSLADRGGFAFWEGFESGFLLNDPWLHGSRLLTPTPFRGYQSDVLVDRLASWLDRRGNDNPCFAVLSLEAPHPPYDAPAAGVEAWAPGDLILSANVPRGGEIEHRARRELAGYYTHLEATDRAIGRLVQGLDDDWMVVFTSVHGDMHGAHGLFRKGWPYEESIRVPLLVRAPGAVPRRDGSAISLLNLHELTLAFAKSQTPTMAVHSPWATLSMPVVVNLPHQCDRVWRGVRTPTRKLVLNADGSPWLFFDLERDPLETTNLIGNPQWHAELEALKRRL